jgi:hypothetical protein
MVQWRHPRFLLLALALSCGGETSSEAGAPDVNLTAGSDGQTVAARAGQNIAIRLGTVGPGNYGDPVISSPAVKFVDMTFPPTQNPGGPTQDYRFLAESAGSAVIRIAHTVQPKTFSVTVNVSN